MARVTVEDCVEKVPNRFQLVMLAAQRARELSVGSELTVERDNDKNPVVTPREIAEETITAADLEEELIQGLQRHADTDDPEEEAAALLAVEEELTASAEADAFGAALMEDGMDDAAGTGDAAEPGDDEGEKTDL